MGRLERLTQIGRALGLLSCLVTLAPSLASEAQATLGPWGALLGSFGLLWMSVTLSWLARHRSAELGGAEVLGARGARDEPLRSRGWSAWLTAALLTALYIALYRQPQLLSGWVLLMDPLAEQLSGARADQWFLYSAVYTGAVLSFAVRSALKGRRSPYVLLRTLSVSLAQLGLAFSLPYFFKSQGLPDFYPSYFWPLKPDYLLPFDYVMNPETGLISAEWGGLSIGRAMLLWAAIMSLIATPILTYLYGKRWYCSWICGCGALAETAGDPWRHLSFKGEGARRWERWLSGSILATIIALTLFLWINEWSGRSLLSGDGAGLFWESYGFVVMMCLSGVIGVGFYPLLGSRSWCRFGCPQAAILGALQLLFKRFHITADAEACVSCGLCTEVCEMGIDVRRYARTGEVVLRASCVGCGACEEVCPRGVLKLRSGS